MERNNKNTKPQCWIFIFNLSAAINCYRREPRNNQSWSSFKTKTYLRSRYASKYFFSIIPNLAAGSFLDLRGEKTLLLVQSCWQFKNKNLLAHYRKKHNLKFKCTESESRIFKSKQVLENHIKQHLYRCLNFNFCN